MRLLLVHPSALMYSEIFLRLEPLGLERVAAAARDAGHEVRAVDLQVLSHAALERELKGFAPHAVGFSLNYLANIPEAIDLARRAKNLLPGLYVFFGGHSVSFVPEDVLEQSEGAVDAVVRGEGEPTIVPLLEALRDGGGMEGVPGIVTTEGRGAPPKMLHTIDADGGDRISFERGKENATECIADGDAVSGLQRAELEQSVGFAGLDHDHLIGFLECKDAHCGYVVSCQTIS